jgi:uncharacterized membrane protein
LNFQIIGLIFIFSLFLISGIGHFIKADFYLNIMPPYIPYHLEIVYISGILEIIGAVGLLFLTSRQLAGNGLILLTLCISPANIYMWVNHHLYPTIPEYILLIRLFLQILLIGLIWWATRTSF